MKCCLKSKETPVGLVERWAGGGRWVEERSVEMYQYAQGKNEDGMAGCCVSGWKNMQDKLEKL